MFKKLFIILPLLVTTGISLESASTPPRRSQPKTIEDHANDLRQKYQQAKQQGQQQRNPDPTKNGPGLPPPFPAPAKPVARKLDWN